MLLVLFTDVGYISTGADCWMLLVLFTVVGYTSTFT